MADTIWFVDEGLATGSNDGTTMDDAWNSLLTAFEYASYNAATRNIIFIRRTSSYTVVAQVDLADTGFSDKPIIFMGWPRPAITNTTITQGDWTSGSAIVDNIVGITCARGSHLGRYATAPNGEQYLITQVVDVNTIKIDREYAGSTVTGVGGKFQIEADEDWADDMGAAFGFDDSAWTIKEATWDADPIDLPIVDGSAGENRIDISTNDNCYQFRNLDFNCSGGTFGMFLIRFSDLTFFQGCLFRQTNNAQVIGIGWQSCSFNRIVAVGSGAGSGQYFFEQYNSGSVLILENFALYNFGDNTFIGNNPGYIFLKNGNIGIEAVNGDVEIAFIGIVEGIDIKIDGSNGYFGGWFPVGGQTSMMSIENYQKVLGDHKTWFMGGEYVSVAISDEVPNEKLSTKVLKITPNVSGYTPNEQSLKVKIPLGEINADAGSQEFKFWIYNGLGVTLNDGDALANFNLAAEYVSSYGDATAYTMATIRSAEHTIAVPANADDWDYLSVTPTIAVESKIRLWLEISVYSAAGYLIVDPQVVIT